MTSTSTESIEDFFDRYTGYLSSGDIDALADIYHYPALAVSPRGCLAVTDPQQTRDFFSQGQQFYRSRGIQGVRAKDIVTDIEGNGIWVGHLLLENLDADGRPAAWSAMPIRSCSTPMALAVSRSPPLWTESDAFDGV